MKGFNTAGNSSLSIRKTLVVFQFVFAACLIVCTAVIYQQLNHVRNKPIGYNKSGLIDIFAEGKLRTKSQLLLIKDQLLKSGAVTDVTYFSQSLAEGGNNTSDFSWTGKKPNEVFIFNYR